VPGEPKSIKALRRRAARQARAEAAQRARRRHRAWRLAVYGTTVAVVLTVGWAVVGANLRSGGSPAAAGVQAEDPVLGQPTAPVTIVEYGDFKCPFCTRFFQQTQPQLKTRYLDTGKVRLVWRDFANIDTESQPAAVAAECARRQGRFWQYHDALYDYLWQGFYGAGRNAEGASAYTGHYDQLARDVGLDLARFHACQRSPAAAQAVMADHAQGASQGVQGTPTFFINGQRLVGAQPLSVFQQLVEQALR
jgi:protein-disulfide isomerase